MKSVRMMKPAAGFLLCLLGFVPLRGLRAQPARYVLYQETFGGEASSPDLGPPLVNATATNYQFAASGNIKDGYYGIRKTTGPMFKWLIGSDHTGNGYMMVINASHTAGKFFEMKVDSLPQGSTFYFSAWIANLLAASSHSALDPDIRFEIRRASDSSLIRQVETGTLSRYNVLTWKEYGAQFVMPAGESSVILQIFNNQKGGSGNDLVLDDITFSIYGPSIRITQEGTYNRTRDICAGKPVSFKADVEQGVYRNPVYQWQHSKDRRDWQDIPGAVNPDYTMTAVQPADSGWYRLLAAEKGNIGLSNGRVTSDPVALHVWSSKPVSISSNGPVIDEGSPLRLSASGGQQQYQWLGPEGFKGEGTELRWEHATPEQQGDYRVIAVSPGGCINTDTYRVVIRPRKEIAVPAAAGTGLLLFPNAFTPNQDGRNDVFHPVSTLMVRDYRLTVLDRWGKVVFKSNDPREGWDGRTRGTAAAMGTYVWMVQYVRSQDGRNIIQHGSVTLLR